MGTLIINIYDSGYDISVVELNHGNGIITHENTLFQKEIDYAYHHFTDEQFRNYIYEHYQDKYRRIIIIDNCAVDIVRGVRLI